MVESFTCISTVHHICTITDMHGITTVNQHPTTQESQSDDNSHSSSTGHDISPDSSFVGDSQTVDELRPARAPEPTFSSRLVACDDLATSGDGRVCENSPNQLDPICRTGVPGVEDSFGTIVADDDEDAEAVELLAQLHMRGTSQVASDRSNDSTTRATTETNTSPSTDVSQSINAHGSQAKPSSLTAESFEFPQEALLATSAEFLRDTRTIFRRRRDRLVKEQKTLATLLEGDLRRMGVGVRVIGDQYEYGSEQDGDGGRELSAESTSSHPRRSLIRRVHYTVCKTIAEMLDATTLRLPSEVGYTIPITLDIDAAPGWETLWGKVTVRDGWTGAQTYAFSRIEVPDSYNEGGDGAVDDELTAEFKKRLNYLRDEFNLALSVDEGLRAKALSGNSRWRTGSASSAPASGDGQEAAKASPWSDPMVRWYLKSHNQLASIDLAMRQAKKTRRAYLPDLPKEVSWRESLWDGVSRITSMVWSGGGSEAEVTEDRKNK